MNSLYSLANAKRFKWSSITGDLNPERVAHLRTYLVGKKILDAGCGGGGYVNYLTEQGLDVTGVDKFDEFLSVAREQNHKGHFVQGDLTSLDFPDDTFDCTFCFDVLEHIDDAAALAELARVTRQRLIIAVPREDDFMLDYNLTFAHYRDKTHLRNYTQESLRETLAALPHDKIETFPELMIHAKGLVYHLLKFDDSSKDKKVVHETNELRELLAAAQYQEIPTGVVGVVDLK